MYILLSPAKSLHEPPAVETVSYTTPALMDDTRRLVERARKLSPKKLQDLMGISEKLATLNHERFQDFSEPFDTDNARQAVLSFNGEVYLGLEAATLSPEDLAFAQDHVGILSGLYGLLRPLDLMQPYRLEMGTRLPTRRGKTLYAFWGDRLTRAINEKVAALGDDTVVNLASNEYFKSVQPEKLKGRLITPVFRDIKDGKARTLSFFAKRARGAMTRWAIENRIETAEQLQRCDAMGYTFQPDQSTADTWMFTRPQPPPVGG